MEPTDVKNVIIENIPPALSLYTVVHVGTKRQIKSLYKAIIQCLFNLNWLLFINKHNILLSEIDMM